jgi:tetratricopeptide (TPR) repeat protein
MTIESSSNSANQNPETLKEEGLALFRQGARDEALVVFESAAQAYSLEGDKEGEAEMYNNMGVIYRLKREWPSALEALNKASNGFLAAEDDVRRAQVLGNVGDLNASRREYDAAARAYSESSELFASEKEGDMQGQVLRAFSLMRLRQRRMIESVDLMAMSISVRTRPSIAQRLFYYLLQIARRLFGTS